MLARILLKIIGFMKKQNYLGLMKAFRIQGFVKRKLDNSQELSQGLLSTTRPMAAIILMTVLRASNTHTHAHTNKHKDYQFETLLAAGRRVCVSDGLFFQFFPLKVHKQTVMVCQRHTRIFFSRKEPFVIH